MFFYNKVQYPHKIYINHTCNAHILAGNLNRNFHLLKYVYLLKKMVPKQNFRRTRRLKYTLELMSKKHGAGGKHLLRCAEAQLAKYRTNNRIIDVFRKEKRKTAL